MKTKAQPGWFVVWSVEVRRLWLGWRGPALLLAFSLFLSVYVAVMTLDPEINVLSQLKMIEQTLQAVVLVGMVVVVLAGADAFSGERDQRTLEGLFLTPVPRGQIALGKLLAVLSLWLGMIVIAAPYTVLVARGTDVVAAALLLLVVPGTFIVGLSAGVSLLISGLSPTNLLSFTASVLAMLALTAPTLLPGRVQDHRFVRWFIVLDPITAAAQYQSAILEGQPWSSEWSLLLSPILILAVVVVLGLWFLNRRVSLLGGLSR